MAKSKKDETEAQAALAKAKEAEKEAARLKKEAEKEKEKEKKAAELAKKKKQAESKLEGEAKTINTRFDKAKQFMEKADDHRLAAAIHLSECKDLCAAAKINYKDWVEENITQSYETVRKLLPIGTAEREEEGQGALMLEDMRNANKRRNKEARERKKSATSAGTSTKETKAPFERAHDAVKSIKKKEERVNTVNSLAEKEGMTVVSKDDAKTLWEAQEDAKVSTRDRCERLFDKMGQKTKVAFVRWAAEEIGGTFTLDGADDDDDDIGNIPEGLKRKK